jgi:hypothetical protein
MVVSKPVFLWLCTKNDIKNNFINMHLQNGESFLVFCFYGVR